MIENTNLPAVATFGEGKAEDEHLPCEFHACMPECITARKACGH